jgi:Diguanylate cyclase, GGDEF domain
VPGALLLPGVPDQRRAPRERRAAAGQRRGAAVGPLQSLRAALVVERLRKQPIPTTDPTHPAVLTFSAGLASIPETDAEPWEQLVELADDALMVAKRTGRDLVCVASARQVLEAVTPSDGEKRRFPRIPTELEVRYLPLPDLAVRTIIMRAYDYSAGGVGVVTGAIGLKRSSYALVYLEHGAGPLLSQVAWTRDEGGESLAGLRFLHGDELDRILGGGAVARPQALVLVSSPGTRGLVRRVLQAAQYTGVFVETDDDIALVDLSQYTVVLVGDSPLRGDIVVRVHESPNDAGQPASGGADQRARQPERCARDGSRTAGGPRRRRHRLRAGVVYDPEQARGRRLLWPHQVLDVRRRAQVVEDWRSEGKAGCTRRHSNRRARRRVSPEGVRSAGRCGR